jgi:hypothetical protein
MTDMNYEKGPQTGWMEPQSVTLLQDIQGPGASRSRAPRVRSLSESIASSDWLSSSIVHDLRNPVATIYAGTEMLMNPDVAPTEVKRLATNMYAQPDACGIC